MHVFIMRHAETDAEDNEHDNIYTSLSKNGIEQADLAGLDLEEYCEKHGIHLERTHAIISPYARTQQTWQHMRDSTHNVYFLRSVEDSEMLQEIEMGALCPDNRKWLKEKDPALLEVMNQKNIRAIEKESPWSVRLPYGESGSDVSERTRSFLNQRLEALSKQGIEAVLIITHNSVASHCIRNLTNGQLSEKWIDKSVRTGTRFSHASIQVLEGDPKTGFDYKGFVRGRIESREPALQNMRAG